MLSWCATHLHSLTRSVSCISFSQGQERPTQNLLFVSSLLQAASTAGACQAEARSRELLLSLPLEAICCSFPRPWAGDGIGCGAARTRTGAHRMLTPQGEDEHAMPRHWSFYLFMSVYLLERQTEGNKEVPFTGSLRHDKAGCTVSQSSGPAVAIGAVSSARQDVHWQEIGVRRGGRYQAQALKWMAVINCQSQCLSLSHIYIYLTFPIF